jgi:hypothetical protein
MKQTYFDEELKITLMDMATVGLSLYFVLSINNFMKTLPPMQAEIVERIRKVFVKEDIYIKIQSQILGKLKLLLILFSQPNFRIYGLHLNAHQPAAYSNNFQQILQITAHECQTLRFKYHNVERTAFRLAIGPTYDISGDMSCEGATIAMSKIFPHAEPNRQLNIFIQSHAIHRFKERIDTIIPVMRNEYLVLSLMFIQKTVLSPNNTPLIACIMPVDGVDKTIGYFAFTIDGDNLFVLTLLPLLSYNVPEGRILYEHLHLSPDDMKYLGMDKLSFFYEIDISQIPLLKQVLYDELHLKYMHTASNTFLDRPISFNKKKTLFVKNFFQKLEEHPLLSDIDQNAEIDLLKE